MFDLTKLGQYRKFLVAVAAFLTGLVATGVLPDKYQAVAHTVIGGLAALGVVAVRNDDYPVDGA